MSRPSLFALITGLSLLAGPTLADRVLSISTDPGQPVRIEILEDGVLVQSMSLYANQKTRYTIPIDDEMFNLPATTPTTRMTDADVRHPVSSGPRR